MTPGKVAFGFGCSAQWIDEALAQGWKKVLLLSTNPIWAMLEAQLERAASEGLKMCRLDYNLAGEPTSDYFDSLRAQAKSFGPDAVVGIGGGSVLDIAKLLAVLCDRKTPVSDCFGKGKLAGRSIGLACAPTTAGTGSEMSPNAILLDSADGEKKGIISPFLLPDVTLLDPGLTLSLPARITAETGMDALCHCIEAIINVHSNPIVDTAALKGVSLIYKNLLKAVMDGRNRPAREALAIASAMGGFCLGPVNTCGVHALSYGLAGKYHLSHGLANAVLLPEVLSFSAPECIAKLSAIAKAMELPVGRDNARNAAMAVEAVRQLSVNCGIPQHLSELGIQAEAIPEMADMAMNVTRLLSNHPREIRREDVIQIYENIY